jgi:hypothetical protein
MAANTYWISVLGSGSAECDGVYRPSTAAATVSESGTASAPGYWNGKMAWDRADGRSKRNPAFSYSNSYKAWRVARLDGHLAYTIVVRRPRRSQRRPGGPPRSHPTLRPTPTCRRPTWRGTCTRWAWPRPRRSPST